MLMQTMDCLLMISTQCDIPTTCLRMALVSQHGMAELMAKAVPKS